MKLKSLCSLWLPVMAMSSLASAQTEIPTRRPAVPASPFSLYQEAPRKLLGLGLEVSAGRASFQDLQAPRSAYSDTRVDGTKAPADSSDHTGIVLTAKLGVRSSHNLGEFFSHLSASRVSGSEPVGAPAASYSRYTLDGGSLWTVGGGFSVLTSAEFRRSMFRNTDNGHYLDAALLRLGFEQSIASFTLTAFAATSVISRFGFMQDSSRGKSGALTDTPSSLQELGGRLSWSPAKEADLFLAMSQESVSANVSAVTAYKNFGFNVSDDASDQEARPIKLTTTIISLGAVRRF